MGLATNGRKSGAWVWRLAETRWHFARTCCSLGPLVFLRILFLLSFREPKSRFTYAKQQRARVDSQDLVAIIDLAVCDLQPHNRLWPYNAQTLRSRFKSILAALKLPMVSALGDRCLDLGSLRSGGATFIILTAENGELCRRRGRWATFKMMEVYVQECMALRYMT